MGIALVAVILSAGLTACSDDDDDNSSSNSLAGTTWKIVELRVYNCEKDEWYEESADVGVWFTFKADGSVATNYFDVEIEEGDDPNEYFIKYTFDGTTLMMNYSNDDCVTGTLAIDGNTATYTCYWYDYYRQWYDYDKPWSNEDEYLEVWTLERQ